MELIKKEDYKIESMYFNKLNVYEVRDLSLEDKIKFIDEFLDINFTEKEKIINELNKDIEIGVVKIDKRSFKPHPMSLQKWIINNKDRFNLSIGLYSFDNHRGFRITKGFIQECNYTYRYDYGNNKYVLQEFKCGKGYINIDKKECVNRILKSLVVENSYNEEFYFLNKVPDKCDELNEKVKSFRELIKCDYFEKIITTNHPFCGNVTSMLKNSEYDILICLYNYLSNSLKDFLKTEFGKKYIELKNIKEKEVEEMIDEEINKRASFLKNMMNILNEKWEDL